MTASAGYDAIVIGIGGMGSAAAYHLARRGLRVLGLERFNIPHTLGSSHGVTRIIRLAYFEHPSYVPLLRRAYELWRDLEQQYGHKLLHITGSIDAGPPGSRVIEGSTEACRAHLLDHEVLNGTQLALRFPGYGLPDRMIGVLQPEGGFLLPELCISAHVMLAQAHGAEIHAREQVIEWEPSGLGVAVRTDRATYQAGQLVISAGAWVAKLVPELSAVAVPERQVLGWFQPVQPDRFTPARFPVFNMQTEEGHYYGLPIFGVPGLKLGRYHHFEERVDPDTMRRDSDSKDENILRGFLQRYFPGAAGATMSLQTCMFTNTPDGHFLIDRHPGCPQAWIVSPCSGHGFKMASTIGEIVADLVQHGSTGHDISLHRLDRLQNPVNSVTM
jgi:sarcosine oxidase